MDLGIWSLIVFASSLLFLVSLAIALTTGPSMLKFGIALLLWFTNQVVTFLYGFYTDQIGFILMAFSEFFVLTLMVILSYRILGQNDNSNSS